MSGRGGSLQVRRAGGGVPAHGRRNAGIEKKWVLRGWKKAEAVMFVWTFSRQEEIPFGLPKREYSNEQYTIARLNEVWRSGGGISEEALSKQRPGILDTGKHIIELRECQGGLFLFNQMIKQGWKISNAYWEERLTEQDKAKGKGEKKCRVKLELSKTTKSNEELNGIKEITVKGLKRLLSQTWRFCHVWDNRKVNKNFVLSFGGGATQQPRVVIVLAE